MTREEVVSEAKTWVGTPYVPGGCVKGAGVDCGMLLIGIFKACGFIPLEFEPRPYPIQHHMHQSAERYLDYVRTFAHEIETPDAGDIVMFKFGKCFSHGAVVTEWPLVIHAMRPLKVGTVNVLTHQGMINLPRRFFSVF